ncbi:MAG: phage head closure protein [Syntrophomonadaceae bacterium]|nr:phage head closure protein [Syntrophomonadaceae bacterium]
MRAGELKKRITIQRETFVKASGSYEHVSTWTDVATVWAAVEPLRGREYFQALETHSEEIIRIKIRYRSGITNEMRVKYGKRLLYIQSVIDVNERHQELELLCVENKPAGPGE